MSFDRLAGSYETLERLSFGGRLQACRVAGLPWIDAPGDVLVLGEGNGRFLVELALRLPLARIHVVDGSQKMLALARRRVIERMPWALDRIRFEQGRLPHFELRPGCYDLLVTNFFLDCFDDQGLDRLLPLLDDCLRRDAQWLLGDFCVPRAGWRRWRAKAWLAAMYAFFRVTTGLEAREWVDPLPRLEALDWVCRRAIHMDRKFLRTLLLERRNR